MAVISPVTFWIDHVNGSDTARTALTSCTASNPSGTITRITKTGHGLTTGAVVDLTNFSAWLNDVFRITKVDDNNFDLDDTVWQATADTSGTITPRGGTVTDPWKTLSSGASLARLTGLAGGYEVKHSKTADPAPLGVNVTLTNGSRTGTLATAQTVTLDNCESGWGTVTNVTNSYSSTRKQGSLSLTMTCASGFSTGEMGYKDLGSNVDLSAYTGVTFSWSCLSGTISAGALQIRMYSDTGRTSLVETLNFPAISRSGTFRPVTIMKGSALSNSVRVIQVYAVTTQASKVHIIDNISACNANFNLNSLIGINDGLWLTMDWIDGTTFGISNNQQAGPTIGYGWPKDTTGSPVALYYRSTYAPNDGGTSSQSTAIYEIRNGGTSATARAKFSFGWNLSNQTQDGETWFDGLTGLGYLLNLNGSNHSFTDFEKCCACRIYMFIFPAAAITMVDLFIKSCKVSACPNPGGVFFNPSSSYLNWGVKHDSCVGYGGQYGITTATSNYNIAIINCELYGQTSYGIYINQSSNVIIKGCTVRGGVVYGIGTYATVDLNIIGCTIKDCARGTLSSNAVKAVYLGCTFANCTEKHYLNVTGRQWLVNCGYDNLTSFMVPINANDGNAGTIYSHNTNNVANDHRIYSTKGTILTDSNIYHGTATFSWKVMPLQEAPVVNSTFPLTFELHRCVCAANVQQTVKVWAQRSNTAMSIGMRVKDANLTGITADTDVLCTADADTWQELTLAFTPTQSGVITIWGVAWGGTTYSGWISDLTTMADIDTKSLTFAYGGQPFSSNSGNVAVTSIPCHMSIGG